MKRKTKLAIYNSIYWIGRVIWLPFDIVMFLSGVLYSYVFDPIDDLLLNWVNKEEK